MVEIKTKDALIDKSAKDIALLKEELLMAKRILKDPGLSQIATRKFNETIDRENDQRFAAEGSVLHDLLKQQELELENYEVEMKPEKEYKVLEGVNLNYNRDVPEEARTFAN